MKTTTTTITAALALFAASPTARGELVPAGTGSGFFITPDGYFVTNFHVIEGGEAVKVKRGDAFLDARVIKSDASNDIAVLKLEGTFPCLPLGEDLETRPGEDVFTIGFPMTDVMGEAPKTTLGTVSAVTGISDDARTFQISVQIQPGNSGGPLVLKNTGNVIGVTSASLNAEHFLRQGRAVPQNVNYAMKSTYIRPLLATVPGLVEKLPPIGADERPWRAVQSTVEECVGLVVVYKDSANLAEQPAPDAEAGGQAPEPEAAPEPEVADGGGGGPENVQSVWIFPDSSSRQLSRAEIVGLDALSLWRARNEIYARNGLKFSSPKGKAFTAALGDFYVPRDADQNRVFARMNRIEQANVELIKKVEQGR